MKFIFKFYLDLPKENREKTMPRSERYISWLTVNMPASLGVSCDAMLFSNLGNENSDSGQINVHAGRSFTSHAL